MLIFSSEACGSEKSATKKEDSEKAVIQSYEVMLKA
jgi:hypothetical protein